MSTIQDQITAAASAAGVSPALALAIVQHESGFNPSAVSPTNNNGTTDYGLFQINSSNLATYGLTPTSALDPGQNIQAGVALLAQLQAQYGDDTAAILSAYNTGSPNNTQSAYVNSVLATIPTYSGTEAASGGGGNVYGSVSAYGDDDGSGSSYPTVDLSSIGLGDITLSPGLIAGVGAGLLALLLLFQRD
jgi:soluble lytic murein transglycosylase-like protein